MIKKYLEYIKEELKPETYYSAAKDLEKYGHRDRASAVSDHGDRMAERLAEEERIAKSRKEVEDYHLSDYNNHYSHLEPFTMILEGGADEDMRDDFIGDKTSPGIYEVYLSGFSVSDHNGDDQEDYEPGSESMIISPRFIMSSSGNGVFDIVLDTYRHFMIQFDSNSPEDPNGFRMSENGNNKWHNIDVFSHEEQENCDKFINRQDALRFKKIMLSDKDVKKQMKEAIENLPAFQVPLVQLKKMMHAVKINHLWTPVNVDDYDGIENKGPKPK